MHCTFSMNIRKRIPTRDSLFCIILKNVLIEWFFLFRPTHFYHLEVHGNLSLLQNAIWQVSIYLSIHLFIHLSIYLSIYQSIKPLFNTEEIFTVKVTIFFFFYVELLVIYLSIYLSIYLFINLSIYLSINLYIYAIWQVNRKIMINGFQLWINAIFIGNIWEVHLLEFIIRASERNIWKKSFSKKEKIYCV